jgi:hypothetical protein
MSDMPMSDMLQLVVCRKKTPPLQHDKLKHIGHLEDFDLEEQPCN